MGNPEESHICLLHDSTILLLNIYPGEGNPNMSVLECTQNGLAHNSSKLEIAQVPVNRKTMEFSAMNKSHLRILEESQTLSYIILGGVLHKIEHAA